MYLCLQVELFSFVKNCNMATIVIMPKQGQSVESCILMKYSKKIGEKSPKGNFLPMKPIRHLSRSSHCGWNHFGFSLQIRR